MQSFHVNNPSDTRTYGPEELRRHRLRRALHELMATPGYRLRVGGGQLLVGPKEAVTPEARQFIQQYRSDLMQHLEFLGEVE